MSTDQTSPAGPALAPENTAPPLDERPLWGVKDVIILALVTFFWIVVGQVVFQILMNATGLSRNTGSPASPIAEFGSSIVFYSTILLISLLYLKLRGYSFSLRVLGFRRTRFWKAVLWTALIFVLDIAGTIAWVSLVKSEPPPVKTEYGVTVLGVTLAVLGIAVMAPVVEELFFRGIIFQGFSNRFRFLAAAPMSAVVFALFHIDPRVYGRIFISGVLFAFLFYRTRSLWPSIGCHVIGNTIAVIALFASNSS